MRLLIVLFCASLVKSQDVGDNLFDIEISSEFDPSHQDLDVITTLEDPSKDDHYSFMSKEDYENGASDPSREVITTNTKAIDCQNIASSFSLVLQPKTITVEKSSDTELSCQLLLHDETEQMPLFLLSWVYKSVDCLAEEKRNQSCEQILETKAFNSSDEVFIAKYNLYKTSENNTGKYTCIAEITECMSEEGYAFAEQSVILRVYIKPDYTSHLAGIAVAIALLLALLLALIFFIRRIQKVQKQRYQELISSSKIQFRPTKVLELPNTAVYNATTTSFDRRSTSSFDSKYSLSSQDEP